MRTGVLILVCTATLLSATCADHSSPQPPAAEQTGTPGAEISPPFDSRLLPDIAELAELAWDGPPRSASVDPSGHPRMMTNHGSAYLPWEGLSLNASRDVPTTSALLAGAPGQISYCVFRLDGFYLTPDTIFDSVLVLHEWLDPPPSGAQGLYAAVTDYDSGRWRIYGPLSNDWVDLSADAIGPPDGNSFIGIVNYSESNVRVSLVCNQLDYGGETPGNEYLYFCQSNPAMPSQQPSLMRIAVGSDEPELLIAGTDSVGYSRPQIYRDGGGHRLVYTRDATTSEVWEAALDGTSATVLVPSAAGSYASGASLDGSVFFWTELNGEWENLYFNDLDAGVSGRFSRDFDDIEEAVWGKVSISEVPGYTAIASQRQFVPDGYDPHSLVRFQAAGTPPLNNTPIALYDKLEDEDAINPDFSEMIFGDGTFQDLILFASAGRDDASFNIYGMGLLYNLVFPFTPEPLMVNASRDLLEPALSPNCRMLAWVDRAPGAEAGSIRLRDFFDSAAEVEEVADNVTSGPVWYDPDL